jgi:opacity protein-like surface antigen
MLRKSLTLIAALLLSANADASITGLGFGIHGGAVSGYNNLSLEESIGRADSTLRNFSLSKNMTNLGVHLNIGTLRIVQLDANIDYAWKKQKIYQDVNLTYSELSVIGTVRKSVKLAILSPYVGVGLGLYRSAYSISSGSITVVLPSNETKLGYHVKGGLELNIPLFPLSPYAEFRYHIIQTSKHSTKFYAMVAGLTLNLP